jgi:methylmalonyl-CoA mutase C-terminal domain/subunit
MTIFPRVLELMREQEAEDITVFGGGVIPSKDVRSLTDLGVAKIFVQDTPTADTISWIRETHQRRSSAVA